MDTTLKDILGEIDKLITWYHKSNAIVEAECGYDVQTGRLRDSRRYDEYTMRRTKVFNTYEQKGSVLIHRLRAYGEYLNNQGIENQDAIPEVLSLGSVYLQYANLNEKISYRVNLPISGAIAVLDEKRSYIQQLMLRILLAFPIRKCTFYVYDPEHYGASIGDLNLLLQNNGEECFFKNKVFYKDDELRDVLDALESMLANISQHVLRAQHCHTWKEYNDKMAAQKLFKKQLGYHVLIVYGVPVNCGEDTLQRLTRLAREGEKFGLFIIFSYHPEITENGQQSHVLRTESIKTAFNELMGQVRPTDKWQNIKLIPCEHQKLSSSVIRSAVERYMQKMVNTPAAVTDFQELTGGECFTKTAITGLEIPIGVRKSDGEQLCMSIGDETPHFLIGGSTGSGKSNLLHNLIVSASVRYSPLELNFYLMDFKDGVEFSVYTNPILPQASLIATASNADYGAKVLDFLNKEQQLRNELFGRHNVSDYKSFRKAYPREILPRIVLLVDEFQTIFEATDEEHLLSTMMNLARKGRSAGIHMVFATQSLRDLTGFSGIMNQFGGKIALHCNTATDSQQILGGLGSNDAAIHIKIPYAILNTTGTEDSNIVFAVSQAEREAVAAKVAEIHRCAMERQLPVEPAHLFNGQQLPALPAQSEFVSETSSLLLGRTMDYDAKYFKLHLDSIPGDNLLICGRYEEFMSPSFFSGLGGAWERIDYIGKNPLGSLPLSDTEVECYSTWHDFAEDLENEDDEIREVRRLLLIDGMKFMSEPSRLSKNLQDKKDFEKIKTFFETANEKGSHIIAFYPTTGQAKSNISREYLGNTGLFNHFIIYDLAVAQLGSFAGGMRLPRTDDAETRKYRAAYADKQREIFIWFQPFREEAV